MRYRGSCLFFGLLSLAGCTITAKEVDDSDDGAGGRRNSSNSRGGASANAGASFAATHAGTGGESDGPCGGVTEAGKCEGDELVYCDGTNTKRLDCAMVGAECVLSEGRADCEVKSRSGSCGDLTALGTCDGAQLKYCDSSSVVVARPATIDCASFGQKCDPSGAKDGGALCVPIGACTNGLSSEGRCEGNSLHFCEDDHEYVFDCGADECKVVSDFADCFMPSSLVGCGDETEAGRCDSGVLVKCESGMVTREDCASLGLSCVTGSPSACQFANCPSTCANGTTCTNGKCRPSSNPSRKWTVLVYMVGDNNLSDAAWADLNEMEQVGSNADVQVVAQWEVSSQFSSLAPRENRGSVYRTPIVKDSDPNVLAGLSGATNLGALDMTEPARLAEFVRWGVETYPSEHTAVILWDHGFGWRGGFVDSGAQGSMSLREIVTGLRDSGTHPDVVAFDACLMGMHEVGMALRGVTDYLVASEEVEPGGGYPFSTVLSQLVAEPTRNAAEFGTAIVDSYASYFDAGLRARSVTMSVVDLSKIEESNAKLASISQALVADLSSNRRGIAETVGSSSLRRFREPESVDLGSMLAAFGKLGGTVGPVATAYSTWLQDSSLVVANRATRTVADAKGQALYLPRVAFSAYGTNTITDYRESTSFLPLQPWHQVVTSLSGKKDGEASQSGSGTTAFSVQLSWGDTETSSQSDVDLDLYVYEPDGDLGIPANGAVTRNGLLSADSGESGLPQESYELRANHASGTYLVLVNLYDAKPGTVAYPKLVIERNDVGSRTYVRGKIADRRLELVPMSSAQKLTEPIGNNNIERVLNLDYSSIWYVTAIDVR